MAGLVLREFSRKLYSLAWRPLSTSATDKPYWSSIFPDGRVRSFEEIPVVEEKGYDFRKSADIYMQFFKKYGYVSKELLPHGMYLIHIYHFDDFQTVYTSDDSFPQRQSHIAMRHYRTNDPKLYDNVGLGAGNGEEWWALRKLLPGGVSERLIRPLQPTLEEVTDDLVNVLHIKANEGGAVDLLPWLFRWEFESIGVVALNRRLDALTPSGSEEADKMVEAASITNEMIGLAEMDYPNFQEYYKKLVPAQDYMYSVIIKYVEEIAKSEDPKGVVKELLKLEGGTTKNAVTLTMDIFQGALQTVPLTVLMALYNLARNKHVQDNARAQILNLLPSRDSKYFGSIKRYIADIPPYLSGILWETLRINPPIIGNGRVPKKDLILGGYKVPKGLNVILHNQVACLLEENFDDPLAFKPERHPTRHQLGLERVFGGPYRICLGRNFAVGQVALAIAKILRDFEVSYDGGEITMINRLHNEPEQPLRLLLKPLV